MYCDTVIRAYRTSLLYINTLGGKSKQDIDQLEVDFVMALVRTLNLVKASNLFYYQDWELYVPLEEYLSFVSTIEGR